MKKKKRKKERKKRHLPVDRQNESEPWNGVHPET